MAKKEKLVVHKGDIIKGKTSEGKTVKGTVYRVNNIKGFCRIETKAGERYRVEVEDILSIKQARGSAPKELKPKRSSKKEKESKKARAKTKAKAKAKKKKRG